LIACFVLAACTHHSHIAVSTVCYGQVTDTAVSLFTVPSSGLAYHASAVNRHHWPVTTFTNRLKTVLTPTHNNTLLTYANLSYIGDVKIIFYHCS